MLDEIGCVAPWLDDSESYRNQNPVCPDPVFNVSRSTKDKMHTVLKDYTNFRYSSSGCKPACLKTVYDVRKIYSSGKLGEYHWIRIYFDDKIQHGKQILKYDQHQLISTFGGELSLWLNLSFLGIIDLVVDVLSPWMSKFTVKLQYKNN
jgi:hypothetical protein